MTKTGLSQREDHNHFGHFDAKYLWPLQPFVDFNRKVQPLRFHQGSIFVEPAPMGGCYVGAVTGIAMAVIHDPSGYMSAPVTIDMPDAAFEASLGPKPIMMTFENDTYAPRLPEWSQPDHVYISSAGTWIGTKMRHPDWVEAHDEFWPTLFGRTASFGTHYQGLDYRLSEGTPGDWRRPIAAAATNQELETSTVPFSPEIVGLFGRFPELFRKTDEGAFRVYHTFAPAVDGDHGPTLVRIENHPEFLGCYMPQKTSTPHAIPEHFLLRTTHEQPRTKQ